LTQHTYHVIKSPEFFLYWDQDSRTRIISFSHGKRETSLFSPLFLPFFGNFSQTRSALRRWKVPRFLKCASGVDITCAAHRNMMHCHAKLCDVAGAKCASYRRTEEVFTREPFSPLKNFMCSPVFEKRCPIHRVWMPLPIRGILYFHARW